jgi:hypothetical protein
MHRGVRQTSSSGSSLAGLVHLDERLVGGGEVEHGGRAVDEADAEQAEGEGAGLADEVEADVAAGADLQARPSARPAWRAWRAWTEPVKSMLASAPRLDRKTPSTAVHTRWTTR